MNKVRFCVSAAFAVLVMLVWSGPNPALAQKPHPDAVVSSTPVATGPPQYFTLNLPAGVSLISAPLETKPGLARDAFLGLPHDWSLFWGWDSSTQSWTPGDEAQMSLGGGYWVFLPTPTTLLVAGQPYGYFKSLTDHVHPGWHLFGIPFHTGIGFDDFKLYVSGNPIGLVSAEEMGLIDGETMTTQGSELIYHEHGETFQPGRAYWVKTNVPLELRAQRATGTPPAASPPLPGPFAAVPGPGLEAQQQLAGGASTASKTMGWLGAIADTLVDVAKGVAAAAEGNYPAAGFEFASGAFGLIEHGLGQSDAPPDTTATSLTAIDGKLDTLISDVGSLNNGITDLEAQISGLEGYLAAQTAIGTPVSNADTLLDVYYTDQTQLGLSRAWARWALAGCVGQLTCPTATVPPDPTFTGNTNEVTTAKLNAFVAANITQKVPGQPLPVTVEPTASTGSTDNFPVWWADGVLGKGAVTPFNNAGSTPLELETAIFKGLTDNMGQGSNGLMSYMRWLVSNNAASCATDPTNVNCDLYDNVYLPLEQYFAKAIGTQAQLVSMIAEAWNVLGPRQSSWTLGGSAFLGGFNQRLNQEAEAFLQVVEQLALYRAGDGRQDWNSFGSSDAGQALARADFVVAQLAGNNYIAPGAPGSSGNFNPPWPSSGVVGRVFYVDGELPLTGTRGACLIPNPPDGKDHSFCASPSFQVGETIPMDASGTNAMRFGGTPSVPGGATGDWAYLKWQTVSGTSQGTATTQWKVQRLVPQTVSLPVGSNGIPTGTMFVVNSTVPERLGAPLTINYYDVNFNTVPSSTAGAVQFGSLSAIEGGIGKYGLKLGEGAWTTTGGVSDAFHQYSVSYTDSTNAPGAAYVDLVYQPTNNEVISPAVTGTWSASTHIQVDLSSQPNFTTVHLYWPTAVNISLKSTSDGGEFAPNGAKCADNDSPYYTSLKVDWWTPPLTSVTATTTPSLDITPCTATAFSTCTNQVKQGPDVKSLSLAKGTNYPLTVKFSSSELPYSSCVKDFTSVKTFRSAIAKSEVSLVVPAPMLTLTK
jgi:hypothetical protein